MSATPKRPAGEDVLPLEICREILNRLPAKSILRCRSVCKSCYSLVSRPDFISDYTARNLIKNGSRVLLKLVDDRASACSFSSHDKWFTESSDHDEAFLGSSVEIVGSCNGLICLSKYEYVDGVRAIRFVIWNPTIRKVVELPSPRTCSRALARYFSPFGFGFDSKTSDYKVLYTDSAYLCSNRNGWFSDANGCEIFDLRKGVWRGIRPLVRSWNLRGRAPECYLDGAVHWTRSAHLRSSDRILLSFDMSDEIFREIRMPDFAELVGNGDGDDGDDNGCIETRSVTFGGLIHVIVWMERDDNVGHVCKDCSVWVMKEYGVAESWTKLFTVHPLSARIYEGVEPDMFLLWENGGVLMVRDLWEDDYDDDGEHVEFEARGALLLYNTEGRTCKQVFLCTKRFLDVCLYEESLVLM